jgi:hypothetical protein
MSENSYLPARQRKILVPVALVALPLLLSAPAISRLIQGATLQEAGGTALNTLGGLGSGLLLAAVFMWIFYRPGRKLLDAMVKANPGLIVIPIYSSQDLIAGLEAFSAVRVSSSNVPSGAFLAFVDVGRRFEIWHWNRGGPERVARVPWSHVGSIAVGTVNQTVTVERAIVIGLRLNERPVSLPISPQKRHLVRMRPLGDAEFDQVLNRIRVRVTENQPRTTPSSETA